MQYDPENCLAKCSYHHKWFWHMKTAESQEWIREHMGKKYEKLRVKARDTYIDFTGELLREIIKKYKLPAP